MGKIKKTFVVILVVLAFIAIAVIIYMYLRIRKRNDKVDETDEEEDSVSEDQLTVQKAVIEKTPLAVEAAAGMIDYEEDESLLVCRMAAESKKFDQATLWKKYQQIKAEDPEKLCSIDNGKIRVEFYHQSYSQVFMMKVVNARGLRCNVPNKELNTRVKILLITPLKTRHIPRRTNVVENSNNPDYNETLDIKLTRKTTRHSTVEVSIWSIDDFYKESLIGGFLIDLRKFDVAQRNIVEEEIRVEFEEHENPGYIMVSLGYKKEEEKLIAIIMRGRVLKCSAHEDAMLRETINPYVKAYLYCNRKRIKKDKSEIKVDQINPVYNQVMEFLVPENLLESTNIIFVVMHKDVRTDSKQNIGRIVVGANSNGRCWDHWKRAIAGEGRMFAQWHQLWH